MKEVIATSILMVVVLNLFGQEANSLQKQAALNRIHSGLSSSDIVNGVAPTGGSIIGTPYLYDTYLPGEIRLDYSENAINSEKIRVHLFANYIEIIRDGKEFVIDGVKVNSLILGDSHYINTNDFVNKSDPVSGFFKVLFEGGVSLYAYHYIIVKKPDYNEALDVGSKDYELLRKTDFYLNVHHKVTLINKKNVIYNLFNDKKSSLKDFIKVNKINFSDEQDLIKLTAFCDSLL